METWRLAPALWKK